MEFRYRDKWTLSFLLPLPHPFPHPLYVVSTWLLVPFLYASRSHKNLGKVLKVITCDDKNCFNSFMVICLAALGLKLQYLGSSVFIVACRIFSCGMWDLVPWPRIEPRPPALGARSLSHWTTISLNKIFLFLNLFPYYLGTLSSETKMWIFLDPKIIVDS